jgi:hypothetical protein
MWFASVRSRKVLKLTLPPHFAVSSKVPSSVESGLSPLSQSSDASLKKQLFTTVTKGNSECLRSELQSVSPSELLSLRWKVSIWSITPFSFAISNYRPS